MTGEPNRTVILGANGNVGTLLLDALTGRDAPVAGSLRPDRPVPSSSPNITWLKVDLNDPSTLRAELRDSDTVIWTPPVTLAPPNLEALESAAPRRVLFISSASVHTRLRSEGAQAKRDAEAAIRDSKLRHTIIRPTMIYGNARDRNLTRVLRYLRRFPLFPLFGDGSGLMQPIHIEDLVDAILKAVDAPVAAGTTYDIGGAAPLSYRRLIKAAARAQGRRVYCLPIPIGLATAMARLANRVGVHIVREEQIRRTVEDKAVDNGPIIADLGVKPRSFVQGIAEQANRVKDPSAPAT